ncbi:hypothetical protein LTR15_004790 [Elasticomyces elasticus]|nr:hypothetical protein LTR15_004790 [Elasticomyces elasticus]
MAMDMGRAQAVKLVLEEIDRHLGHYDTQEKRRAMLADLIAKQDLKTLPRKPKKPVPYTEDILEADFLKAVANAPSSQPTKNRKVDVWRLGSSLVGNHYLGKIGFEPQIAVQETEDDDADAPAAEEELHTVNEQRTPPHILPKAPAVSPLTPQEVLELPNPAEHHNVDALPTGQKRRRMSLGDDSSASFVPSGEVPADTARPKSSVTGRAKSEATAALSARSATGFNTNHQAPKRLKNSEGTASVAQSAPLTLPGPPTLQAETATTTSQPLTVAKPPSPPRASLFARSLVRLNASDVQRPLEGLWGFIQSITRNALKGVGEKRASWVSDPNDEFLKVYQHLFGWDWKIRVMEIMQYTSMDRKAALEACLAGTIYEMVFNKDLPWDGPIEILAMLEKDVPMMDRILDRAGCRKTMEYVVWQTTRAKLEEDEFRDQELRPIADKLAQNAMLMLDYQLHRLDARSRFRPDQLALLIADALLLKGKIRVAPDYYEVTWVASGKELVRSEAEEINESQGRQEVLYCVSPLVKVRTTTEDAWLICARAKVFTRPWVEQEEEE